MRVRPPEVRLTLPTRTDIVPLTQCRAVSTQCGAMIVPEQVNEPLLSTAAAHGADETVLPPMIGCGPAGAARAPELAPSRPAAAVASTAIMDRMRMGAPSGWGPGSPGRAVGRRAGWPAGRAR